jgi:hypothetical protein
MLRSDVVRLAQLCQIIEETIGNADISELICLLEAFRSAQKQSPEESGRCESQQSE